jgi:hypothetical protein
LLEEPTLQLGQGRVGDFGTGEVGENAFEIDSRIFSDGGKHGVETRTRSDALTRHASVDFEVNREGTIRGFRDGGEWVNVLGKPDNWGKVVLEQEEHLFPCWRGHDDDARLNTSRCERFPKGDRFLSVGYAQPGCSGMGQSEAAKFGAVPISVGFNNSQDCGFRACGLLEQFIVCDEAAPRDLHPGLHAFYPNWSLMEGQ